METYHYNEHRRPSPFAKRRDAKRVNYQTKNSHHPAKYCDEFEEAGIFVFVFEKMVMLMKVIQVFHDTCPCTEKNDLQNKKSV